MKKLLSILLSLAVFFSMLPASASAEPPVKASPTKRLTVTAIQDRDTPSVQVPLEELDPGNKASLTYVGLTDVCIDTSQGKKALETGI